MIIAGAGGAAHLPGMTASMTPLPVIGVPVPLQQLDGLDSLLSIVQMPGGIPVATVAVGNAKNAGLLAVRILGTTDDKLRAAMDAATRPTSRPRCARRTRAVREQLRARTDRGYSVRDGAEDVELGRAAGGEQRGDDADDAARARTTIRS